MKCEECGIHMTQNKHFVVKVVRDTPFGKLTQVKDLCARDIPSRITSKVTVLSVR